MVRGLRAVRVQSADEACFRWPSVQTSVLCADASAPTSFRDDRGREEGSESAYYRTHECFREGGLRAGGPQRRRTG